MLAICPVEALPGRANPLSLILAERDGDLIRVHVPVQHVRGEASPAFWRVVISTKTLSDPTLPAVLRQAGCDISVSYLQALPRPDDCAEYQYRFRQHVALKRRLTAGDVLSEEEARSATCLPTREGVEAANRGADRQYVALIDALGGVVS